MRYHFYFFGRQRGALGIREHHERIVDADDVGAGILALYETHEHISVTQIETVTYERKENA